jgi:peptidoglycan/LPS O-acetylase OafA/YrhL
MIHYWVKDWVKILFVTHGGPQLLPAVVYLAATAGLSVLLYHAVEVPGRTWLRGRPPFFVAPFHWAARP